MSSLSLFRRRDPWWGADGKAARRTRLRRQVVALAAFVLALGAIGGAVFAWVLALGFGGVLGLPGMLVIA